MNKPNWDNLQEEAEKKAAKRKGRKGKMKVSGSGVKRLQGIISGKGERHKKKGKTALMLASAAAIAFVAGIFPQCVEAERIDDFSLEIKINRDSSVEVAEKIMYDFGNETRHGIIREIPYRYETGSGKRKIEIRNISALANGRETAFQKSKEGDNFIIKIGDKDATLSGKQAYEIRYQVRGAVNFFDSHDELYWNITGHGWPADILQSKAEIILPEKVSEGGLSAACYSGPEGSTNKCVSKRYIYSGPKEVEKVVFADDKLAAGNGVTFVLGLPKGLLERQRFGSAGNMIGYAALAVPIGLLAALSYLWWTRGRDPGNGKPVIARYSPPDGLTPSEAGTLLDQRVHQRDITAEIVNLAVKGCLKITRLRDKGLILPGDDYMLESTGKTENLSRHEAFLLENLFKKGSNIKDIAGLFSFLSGEKNPSGDGEESWIKLSEFYRTGFGAEPDKKIASGKTVKISDLRGEFASLAWNFSGMVYAGLVGKGYFRNNPRRIISVYAAAGAGCAVIGFLAFPILGVIGTAALVCGGLITGLFGLLMPARTMGGVEAKGHVLGLKLYLSVAEKDRIKFHNSPEKDPKEFEKHLPYAIAFGVEKEWARQFKDIYQAKPEWYSDTKNASFSAAALAGGLKTFRRAASQAYSQASRGGSGFSGGASGGGFGGGGGRSW